MLENEAFRCPLCGANQYEEVQTLESFGQTVRYYLCTYCGMVSQDPNESPAADPDFYAKTYRETYQNDQRPTPKDLRQQRLRAASVAGFLSDNHIFSLGRVLDIGAAAGILLEKLREEFKAQPVGIEPSDAYRAEAMGKNIPIYHSLEELGSIVGERFELVSLMHVLEHLTDPKAVLVRIREKYLSPKGYLLVEVPNFYAHDSYELAHLSCFTPHTLQEILQQAGFELITLRQHGAPRSKTLPLFLTALARSLPDSVSPRPVIPEKAVMRKRKAGMLWRKLVSKVLPTASWLPMEDR